MRAGWMLLLGLSACATSTSRYDTRLTELERQVAELQKVVARVRRVDPALTATGCAAFVDVSVPFKTKLAAPVAFDMGKSTLTAGDRIVIQDVRGTRPDFAVGGAYLVRGTYTLTSADEAILGFSVRAARHGDGCTRNNTRGRVIVKRGSGAFRLVTRFAYVGEPGIAFYRAHNGMLTNDDDLGRVAFGKGAFAPR